MTYADLAVALNRARELSAASTNAVDTLKLTEFLEMSKATRKDTGAIEYRPFWAAARYRRQSPRDQTIAQAEDGVKFTGMAVPVVDYLETQRSLDLSLNVPLGFEANDPGASMQPSATAAKAAHDSALLTLKKYLPR